VLKLALEDGADPQTEPTRFRAILAKAGGEESFEALRLRLARAQKAAHAAYERIVARR